MERKLDTHVLQEKPHEADARASLDDLDWELIHEVTWSSVEETTLDEDRNNSSDTGHILAQRTSLGMRSIKFQDSRLCVADHSRTHTTVTSSQSTADGPAVSWSTPRLCWVCHREPSHRCQQRFNLQHQPLHVSVGSTAPLPVAAIKTYQQSACIIFGKQAWRQLTPPATSSVGEPTVLLCDDCSFVQDLLSNIVSF